MLSTLGWVVGAGCSAGSSDFTDGSPPASASTSATAVASAPAATAPPVAPSTSSLDRSRPRFPPPDHVFVGSTSEHACATSDGDLYCWGRNDTGQLGKSDPDTDHLAGRVPVAGRVVEASLGVRHTCALLDSGQVHCIGEDASGRRDGAEAIGGLTDATHIVSGADFACATTKSGAVLCWGRVPGGPANVRDATQIGGLYAKALAASTAALCALTEAGQVLCVGSNARDALVQGGPPVLTEPTPIAELEQPIIAIAIADEGVCALAESKRVNCHGVSPRWEGPRLFACEQVSYGAVGVGCCVGEGRLDCQHSELHPQLGYVRGDFREIGVGNGFACALPTASGPVVCFGRNERGALGASPPRARPTPARIDRLQGATRIDAGDASVCGLVGHTVRCFGDHERKEPYGTRPVGDAAASEIAFADDITVGGGIRCGMTQGLASCWGDNRANGIISANPGSVDKPMTLASLGTLRKLTFGATHACGVSEDRTIRCWGGVGLARAEPTVVRGFGDVHQLEAGGDQVCALLADGGVACAPFEGDRALKPTRVAGARGLVSIAVGGRHVCGIDAAGSVACFGANDRGQLGRGERDATAVGPVVGLPTSKAIAAGAAFTCALGEDDQVRCWGDGLDGQLGRRVESTETPAVVEGLAAVTAITAGERHACVLQRGGAVLCWGEPRFGRFLFGDIESSADPRPIPLAQAGSR